MEYHIKALELGKTYKKFFSKNVNDVLKSLTHLEELDLTGTKITAEGIEAIRKALPNCKVVWEGEGGPESK